MAAGRTRFIYFAASIRAGRGDAPIYHKLVKTLKAHGTVLTEHVGSSESGTSGKCPLLANTASYMYVLVELAICMYWQGWLYTCIGRAGYIHVLAELAICMYWQRWLYVCIGRAGYIHVLAELAICMYMHL